MQHVKVVHNFCSGGGAMMILKGGSRFFSSRFFWRGGWGLWKIFPKVRQGIGGGGLNFKFVHHLIT